MSTRGPQSQVRSQPTIVAGRAGGRAIASDVWEFLALSGTLGFQQLSFESGMELVFKLGLGYRQDILLASDPDI